MAVETIELTGGPWDGGQVKATRDVREALVWWRGGESIDTCAATAGTLVNISLPHPTRHRYRRTDRRTAGGATVFRHEGRMMDVFA